MKKRLAAIGVIFLFITLCFGGCEELEKPDYITVECRASITGLLMGKDNATYSWWASPEGLPIRVDFIKAGGESFTLQCEIGMVATAATDIVSFKLYREQPIEAVMTVQGGYQDFYPTVPVQYATLTWETVDAAADFGGSYYWCPEFKVYLNNDTKP